MRAYNNTHTHTHTFNFNTSRGANSGVCLQHLTFMETITWYMLWFYIFYPSRLIKIQFIHTIHVPIIAENKHTNVDTKICNTQHEAHYKLTGPQKKHKHKKMKADKGSRVKVTNWPTRESRLHFKRLHCLLHDFWFKKKAKMFPRQLYANRSKFYLPIYLSECKQSI